MVFEYLTVLISVVVGLSVTSFLTNVARIIHVRDAVTISWVQLLWSMVILIWTIAFWWFTFVLAEQPEWTFPLFVFLLVYSTLLFFMMALLFPEGMPADHNYRAQFMRNRVWFFGVLLLFLCVDLIDYRSENLLFHRIFAVYSLLAVLVMSVTTLLPLAT